MGHGRACAAGLVGATFACASPSVGQGVAEGLATDAPALAVVSGPVAPAGHGRTAGPSSSGAFPVWEQAEPAGHRVTPMLLSLAVPGVGQRVLGQRRGWVYLALETLGWAVYLERRSSGADVRTRYRDLVWEEARLQTGPRVDGDFTYYETLTKWTRSGAYDADPAAPGVQPESDPATFNGSVWALAVGIFVPGGPAAEASDPSYQSALAYYRERAYPTELLWDWSGTGGAQAELGRLIERSDRRFRQATHVLGAVLANHVVSAVDAYLSARGLASPVSLRVAPGPWGSGLRWSGHLRVPLSR